VCVGAYSERLDRRKPLAAGVDDEPTEPKSLPALVIMPPTAHKKEALLLKLPNPQISNILFIAIKKTYSD
jgi:hypothetical protein